MSRNTIEEELNKIRIKLYEETKDLTLEERRKRAKERRKMYEKKYGLKFINRV
jgi:hypothetical protein